MPASLFFFFYQIAGSALGLGKNGRRSTAPACVGGILLLFRFPMWWGGSFAAHAIVLPGFFLVIPHYRVVSGFRDARERGRGASLPLPSQLPGR